MRTATVRNDCCTIRITAATVARKLLHNSNEFGVYKRDTNLLRQKKTMKITMKIQESFRYLTCSCQYQEGPRNHQDVLMDMKQYR